MLDLRDDTLSPSLLSVDPPFPSRHSRLVCPIANGSPSRGRRPSKVSGLVGGPPESWEQTEGCLGKEEGGEGEAGMGWMERWSSSSAVMLDASCARLCLWESDTRTGMSPWRLDLECRKRWG